MSAKYFPRSLASFALVPNPKVSSPLTSKVMVVNKDGDLELYALYDTPKLPIWSSRGDLAIGAGVGLKVIEGCRDTTLGDAFSSESVSQSRSRFKYDDRDKVSHLSPVPTRDHSIARGRTGQPSGHLVEPLPVIPTSLPPTFEADNEEPPTLSRSVTLTGLSATRPSKTRTYSPASVRKYRRSQSRTDTIPAEEPRGVQRITSPRRSIKSREVKKQGFPQVVQDDISMVMRRRVLAGYGLSKVCCVMSFHIECLFLPLSPRTISL